MHPREEITDPTTIACTECPRKVNEFEAIEQHWTYWSAGTGDLRPFCPECAEQEFGLKPRTRRTD